MFIRHGFAALALQCLAGIALADGLEKRSKVTLTRTVTRVGTKSAATPVTSDGSVIPVTSEAAVETTTIDGETVIVQTTITSPCTECAETSEVEATSVPLTTTITQECSECPGGTTVIVSTQAESSADAETTAGFSSSEAAESTPVVTTTITQACTECLGGTTVIVSTLASTDFFTSTLGSTASSALAETTSGSVTDATASGTVPIGSETISTSIILTTGYSLTTISSASGIYTNTTTAIPGTTAVSEVSSSDIAITSNIPSTGGSSAIPTGESSAIFSNSTVIVPGTTAISEASSNIVISTPTGATDITDEPTGGEIITRTVTRDGSIQVTTATVTATVGQPVIIIIQQITLFIFTSNLGSTCPVVTPGDNGGFVVDGEGHDDIGSACRTACYKQFAKCTANSGTSFRVKDCQTQLGACMKAASTQTVTGSPVTLTQTVVLPPNCPTQAVSDGVSIISSKTLTGGEIATIGTGGVSVITKTGTFIPSETGVVSSAEATGIPETLSHFETTKGVTVTAIDESGSAHLSVVTMTLTVPEVSASGSQSVEVGSTGIVTSDVSTVTLLPSGTRTTTEISVIKSTYTIPVESASGTSVGSSAIGSGTTSLGGTRTVGTGLASTSLVTMSLPPIDGTGTGQTTVVTMTISNGPGPSGSGTVGVPTSLPGTAVTSETAVGSTTEAVTSAESSADATGTHTITISTNVVTVTIGTQTGVITLTQTGTQIVETVTVTGKCGGGKVTDGAASTLVGCPTAATKTETVTETTCPISSVPATTVLATATQDPNETAYVTVTVDAAMRAAASRAAASEAALIQRVRRGFGGW
ncbi:Fc.00g098040.m01.CDS01 [Cosmosporella sp. VM-42]